MTSTLVCIFALLAVVPIFSLPLEPGFNSTSFPVPVVEEHFPRGFTDEFSRFTSTFNTPMVAEREVGRGQFPTSELDSVEQTKRGDEESKPTERDVFTHDHSDLALNGTEATKRAIEESESVEVEATSTGVSVHDKRTLQMTEKVGYKTPNVASRSHDEDDEEEESTTKKSPKKIVKEEEKEESSVESEELTTLSGRLAQFDPTLFDSVSTPAGTQLQFDENQQSIDRPTTELNENTTETAIEEEKKEKRLTLVPLNQGQNSSLVEEKKSNH